MHIPQLLCSAAPVLDGWRLLPNSSWSQLPHILDHNCESKLSTHWLSPALTLLLVLVNTVIHGSELVPRDSSVGRSNCCRFSPALTSLVSSSAGLINIFCVPRFWEVLDLTHSAHSPHNERSVKLLLVLASTVFPGFDLVSAVVNCRICELAKAL
jgi:hypothetical protein